MNILIIGGLLGLAVLAILVAVLLGVSEDRAEKAKKASAEQPVDAPAMLPQQSQSRQTVDFAQTRQTFPAYPAVPAATPPARARSTITLPVSDPDETLARSFSLAELNGEVREITDELRALAHRAGELQQRLVVLSETLENREPSHAEPEGTGATRDLFTPETETPAL